MRARGFQCVLHDVHLGTTSKQMVIDHLMLKEPEQAVVAREPYGHQEGYHIHVFYRLKSQSDFKAQLKHWALWYKGQRVQVDVMRGTMAQACRYLMQDATKKDKTCDSDPWFYPTPKIVKSPAEHAEDWLDWFVSTPMDEWRKLTSDHRDRFLVGWVKSQADWKNKNIGIC